MNTGQWLNAAAVLLGCLGGYLSARLTAKAQSRKIVAEAHDLEVQTQNRITKRWNAELARRDKHIDKQDEQLADFSRRLQSMDSDLQDAREQTNLTQEQLDEERRANGLLRVALETAQAHLVAALADLDNAKQQIKVLLSQKSILTEHARRMDVWLVKHFNENGHTNETDKPPTLTPFDVSAEDT